MVELLDIIQRPVLSPTTLNDIDVWVDMVKITLQHIALYSKL